VSTDQTPREWTLLSGRPARRLPAVTGGDELPEPHSRVEVVEKSAFTVMRRYSTRLWEAEGARGKLESAIAASRESESRLREALAEAMIPLEALNMLGHRWGVPRLQRSWDRLVTSELREQVTKSVETARAALASTKEKS
jgi:hypothetical protein